MLPGNDGWLKNDTEANGLPPNRGNTGSRQLPHLSNTVAGRAILAIITVQCLRFAFKAAAARALLRNPPPASNRDSPATVDC